MKKPCSIVNSWEVVTNQASRDCTQPAVSVVISLYNYSAYIQGCLESVRASQTDGMPGGFEVVVVDDCSTDASTKVVEEYLATHALPVCLVKKLANSGLADTRNIGLQFARAPLVFILDADNEIRPDCLRAHYQVLAASSHAMAYGFINRFDHSTRQSIGMMSHSEWDVQKLVSAPQIDAMAMIRKEVVLQLGGYSTEYGIILPQGWEDYDLCLKLAQAGYSGKLIPQVLSDYRVHGTSMLHSTTLFQDQLAGYFARKFHYLIQQHSDLPKYFGISRNEIAIANGRGKKFSTQRKNNSADLVHKLLGKKLCRSICKRLAAIYSWLHP